MWVAAMAELMRSAAQDPDAENVVEGLQGARLESVPPAVTGEALHAGILSAQQRCYARRMAAPIGLNGVGPRRLSK